MMPVFVVEAVMSIITGYENTRHDIFQFGNSTNFPTKVFSIDDMEIVIYVSMEQKCYKLHFESEICFPKLVVELPTTTLHNAIPNFFRITNYDKVS